MAEDMVATPLNSFEQIRGEWLDLLEQCPVNTFFLMPQWQEIWWDAFRDGREMAGFYLNRPEGVTAIASLARQGDDLSFVGNTETFDYNDFMIRPGWEDDFFAHRAGDPPMLIQVCLETAQDATWERELRALQAGGKAYPDATRWLVTLDSSPPRRLPDSVTWASASSWLLGDW